MSAIHEHTLYTNFLSIRNGKCPREFYRPQRLRKIVFFLFTLLKFYKITLASRWIFSIFGLSIDFRTKKNKQLFFFVQSFFLRSFLYEYIVVEFRLAAFLKRTPLLILMSLVAILYPSHNLHFTVAHEAYKLFLSMCALFFLYLILVDPRKKLWQH